MLLAKPEKKIHRVYFEGIFKSESRTKWVHDGIVLVNMLENLEIDDPDFFVQIIICTGCGYSECARGNYVKIRRNGSLILWLPVDQNKLEDDYERDQYTTAKLLNKHGIILFEWDDFKHISNMFAHYENPEKLPKHISQVLPLLSGDDLQGLWAYELPTKFKKENYIFAMSEAVNSIIACKTLEIIDAKSTINEIFQSFPDWNNPVIDSIPQNNMQIETVFLDKRKSYEWAAIVNIAGKWWPYLGQGYVLKEG